MKKVLAISNSPLEIHQSEIEGPICGVGIMDFVRNGGPWKTLEMIRRWGGTYWVNV